MSDVANRLAVVNEKIRTYAIKYHRDPATIMLLAASKAQPLVKLQQAYEAGQRVFGESYVQEALEKMSRLPSDINWHFIGHIQSNKTKSIAEHFSWVHSVDSIKIATRLNDQRPPHLPPLNICIEVNLNHEKTKSGLEKTADLIELATTCQQLPQLSLRGLMAIPAPRHTLTEQRQEFRQLTALADLLKQKGFAIDTLSMGMSEDVEAAIAEGSTLVRIGTAIFGQRPH